MLARHARRRRVFSNDDYRFRGRGPARAWHSVDRYALERPRPGRSATPADLTHRYPLFYRFLNCANITIMLMFFATTTGLITKFWPLWTAWIGAFLVIEFTALGLRKKYPDTNNSGGTLSELVWWLIRGKAWYHHVLFAALLAFFIDLGSHFFIGTSLL